MISERERRELREIERRLTAEDGERARASAPPRWVRRPAPATTLAVVAGLLGLLLLGVGPTIVFAVVTGSLLGFVLRRSPEQPAACGTDGRG